MRPRVLLEADPPNPPSPGTPPAPPQTPKQVQKTPIKTPNEIRLEKELATLQDRFDGLEGQMAEVNTALQGLNVGGPPKAAPVAVKLGSVPAVAAPAPAAPPQPRGFLQTVEDDIWGNQKAS